MSQLSPPSETPHGDSSGRPPEPSRRLVVELLTGFLSFLLVAVPSAIGGLFFLDPLLRGRKGSDGDGSGLDGYIKLDVGADSIPTDGTPVAVSVRTDLDDAWNRFKDVPVGSIWIRRNSEGQLTAFNSVCPHLGCSVNFRRSANDFYCPCHTSAFSLDGTKTNDVPPRDMDTLEIVTVADGKRSDSGTELWVKFQNFRKGCAEKTAV